MDHRAYTLDRMLTLTADLFIEKERELFWSKHSGRPAALLDIGCGNGAYLAKLSGLYPDAQCTGIELEEHMHALAQRRVGRATKLLLGSYEQLVDHAAYDVIVARLVVLHLPDLRGFVRWLRDRCDDRSVIYILDFDDSRFQGSERLPLFTSLYQEARRKLRGRRTFLELPDMLKLEFEYAGFSISSFERYSVRTDETSIKRDIYEYMKLSTEYLLGMPITEDRAEELLDWLNDTEAQQEIPMFGTTFRLSLAEECHLKGTTGL